MTGVLVLLSLDLTSLFYYIPKSALAAVIVTAVAPLFDVKIVRRLWRVQSTYAKQAALRWSLPVPRAPIVIPPGLWPHCGLELWHCSKLRHTEVR